MDKYALYSGVGPDGDPRVQMIRPGEFVKTASAMLPEVESFIATLRPDPAYTYVLVNAMGYSEFYGSNSNKDWYGYNQNLDFNGLLHAPADWGQDLGRDKATAKTWSYGYPTYYNATAFAHHKNSDPKQHGFGDVIFVAPNHKMKRIELVIRVDNAEIKSKGRDSILDRLHHGERVDVSMGCKVPFDLCSVCTDWAKVKAAWKTFDPSRHAHPGLAILDYHRKVSPIRGLSITMNDHCEDMKVRGGTILPDGRKIFVFNDFCRFFDISFVWIGADRTARVMWFLSDRGEPSMLDALVRPSPSVVQEKTRSAIKTAMEKTSGAKLKSSEIEKQIPSEYVREIRLRSSQEPDIDPEILSTAAQGYGVKNLLSTLAALGIVLRPHEFQKAAGYQGASTFSTKTSKLDSTYAVSGDCINSDLLDAFAPYQEVRSSFAPYLEARMKTAGVGPKLPPIGHDAALDKLAAQYNGYRVSILERAPEIFDSARGPGSDLLKASSMGWAPLLLGLGPMVHFLSSHLHDEESSGKELGSVAKFVSDNPTFISMATIGAGLRAAIAIEAAGGLTQAVKELAKTLL